MPTVVEQHADAKLDLDEYRAEQSDAFGARVVELMERPEERDPDGWSAWLGRIGERAAEEMGSEEAGAAFAQAVGEAAEQGWTELHQIPVAPRGKVFSAAQEFIAGASFQQAYVELMMERVAELAEENGKRLGKVRNPDDLRGVRNTMQERKEIREAVGAEKAQATEPDIG